MSLIEADHESILTHGIPHYTMRVYRQLRANGWMVPNALHAARTRWEWDQHVIHRHDPGVWSRPFVRMRVELDDSIDIDDILGDAFNPKYVDHISPKKLEEQKKKEIERINQLGVWYAVTEYWDGKEWQQADICGGFVGQDDVWESGYADDLCATALDAARKAYDAAHPDYELLAMDHD